MRSGELIVASSSAAGLGTSELTGLMLFQIALILLVARLVGSVAARVGQPRVVGEIIAGVLLGPTILGWPVSPDVPPWSWLACEQAWAGVTGDPTATGCLFPPQSQGVLQAIGQLGLALYMFLVGMELDWDALRGRVRAMASISLGSVVVPLIAAVLILPWLYDQRYVASWGTADQPTQLIFALMVGAMLSVTAFPVMARILDERNMTRSEIGRVGLASAAVTTVLMFVVVAIADALASGVPFGRLALGVGASLVYVVVMLTVVRRGLVRFGRSYEDSLRTTGAVPRPVGWAREGTGVGHGLTTQMFVGAVLLLLVSALVAHVLGLTVIIGGFLAGAAMPSHAELARDMTDELFDVTAVVLLPVFLAFSGLRTDFTVLDSAMLAPIGLFLVAGVLSKWGGGVLCGRATGLNWSGSNAVAWLMNCRGLLVLVVALIAIDAGVITPGLQTAAVIMALVTTAMTGPMFDLATRGRSAREPGTRDGGPDLVGGDGTP